MYVTTHEGSVGNSYDDLGTGPAGEFGSRAGMVVVEVGEHDAPQFLA